MLLARLSVLAACLLTSCGVVLAAHVHHATPKAASVSVEALEDTGTTYSRAATKESREVRHACADVECARSR
ncbi:hypothetical protein OH76DRAFT_1408116 [Lentinus brumalis]|uniref:Lipoprotein n=1 Tax=Lentinus brumalis TaxID=2498619 RepID=A0A371CYG5_9APHY|nr:hypothetical protein OH76DRAFT_1408116 [Polyporus brumalis]